MMENTLTLEANSQKSEDIIAISRNVPAEQEHFGGAPAFVNTEKSTQCLETFEEMSDDSEDELELAVDAIHPRLSNTYYLCVGCRKRFVSKKLLYSHFEEGCNVTCKRCGKRVYEKTSGCKEVFIRKCSKKCHPVVANEVVKE